MTENRNAPTSGSAIALADIIYLCRIPRMFRAGGKSARQLVRECRMVPSALTVEAIKSALDEGLRLIDEWQQWSQGKRALGWFLTIENDPRAIGRLPEGDRLVFPNPVIACAEFILRKLHELA